MTRPGLIRAIAIGMAPLVAALGGCAAFNLGPRTDAAIEADRASPGYPRLVDVPQPPADVLCPAPPPQPATPRVTNVLAGLERLAELSGAVDAREPQPPRAAQSPALCPPDFVADAEQLIAARDELGQAAAEIRAARPDVPDARIELPPDFGQLQAPGTTARTAP